MVAALCSCMSNYSAKDRRPQRSHEPPPSRARRWVVAAGWRASLPSPSASSSSSRSAAAAVLTVSVAWIVLAVAARRAGRRRRLRPRPAQAQHPAQLPARSGTCASRWRRCGPSCSSTSSSATPTAGRTTATRARRSTSAPRAIKDEQAFGTERDVTAARLRVAAALDRAARAAGRAPAGADRRPGLHAAYDMALLNVSAMSFGALSKQRAERAQPRRASSAASRTTPARAGSPSTTSRAARPDLGARQRLLRRAHAGRRLRRARVRATRPPTTHVKLVSLKLSQGAKPGIGGQLPGSKVTEEIARRATSRRASRA